MRIIKNQNFMFFLSCAFILIAAVTARQYFLTGTYTYKSLIITGWQAICVIITHAVIGVYGIYLSIKDNKSSENHEIGKYKVVVKNKNESFGVVNSLDLIFNEGKILTFYCTTDKVAVMLLNDFAVNQKVELEIKSADGFDCELIGKNAYAHGRVMDVQPRP